MHLSARKPRRRAGIQAPHSQPSLDAERACRAAGITDPVTELPLLIKLADISRRYRGTSSKLAAARKAWTDFAAINADDDPGHEEHRQRVVAARAVHTAVDEEFSAVELELAVARGELPAMPAGINDRLARARQVVAAAEGRA